MISVCVITYNQEAFITECLNSLLEQDYPGDWEIVIGEDGSTDRTRLLCEQVERLYPHRVRLLPKAPNMGMIGNFRRTLDECRGEYVAFIEGDDYWTDPLKLQAQHSFLADNPDHSLCFHNVTVKWTKNNTNTERPFHTSLSDDSFTTEDLLAQWFVPSGSVMFRNYPDLEIPEWFNNCKSGDIPFLLLLSLKGKLKYLDRIMGVYRVHDAGISSRHNGYEKIIAMMFIYENFNIYTKFQFHKRVREAMIYEIDRHYPGKQVAAANQRAPIRKKLVRNLKAYLGI